MPLYVWFSKIHWIPSFKPLIVPNFLGDAFSIFLLRQFFMSVPEDLADAARVDGASDWQIMTRIMVPLSKPAIAAIALFNFLYNWNDFFGPLLFVGDNPHLFTLAIGLDAVPWSAPRRVQPDHGGFRDVHDPGDPVLPGPEGVRRGRHAHGVKG